MTKAKLVCLAGLSGMVASLSSSASPLNITFTGGVPALYWGFSLSDDPGFQDVIPASGAPASSINLAGVNSITMTWSAPAGYMYVVNPPPAAVQNSSGELYLVAEYGSPGQASSLGSIIGTSWSVHTIYGTSPLAASVIMNASGPALYFGASGGISSSSAPFAFTSLSISANFSGTGTAQTLQRSAYDGTTGGDLFGIYVGEFAVNGPGTYDIPPDPGSLITLEPLPTGNTPDKSSTLGLAAFGFGSLLLFGRKRFSTVAAEQAAV